MRLRDYLHHTRNKDETVYQRFKRFGKSVGVSMDCIRKYVYGSRRVPDEMKRKIIRVTNGRVTLEELTAK